MKHASSNHEVWSTEQDKLLLETVLQHLSNGSSQKKAFEDVAGKIGRTLGACAFRFNSVLRKQHGDVIRSVQNKNNDEVTSRMVIDFPRSNNSSNEGLASNWEQVLNFLHLQSQEVQQTKQMLQDALEENTRLTKELEHLKQIRSKMESLGMNISKILDLFNT
ncbi:hypothetical protein ACYEXS_23535 [Paenibacillus sp. MAH-36]|uniref:Myb-like domain-containing protein n=1 Tax=Paenibacillus violae TaxID=3077234 RepID=A0ABU3RNF1_9BACL|nr:hypothetical protein [Paenibacillus sp. PFR10]MDU0205821.1 hypothetical protein [Paenibacillus sp. PFR10]